MLTDVRRLKCGREGYGTQLRTIRAGFFERGRDYKRFAEWCRGHNRTFRGREEMLYPRPGGISAGECTAGTSGHPQRQQAIEATVRSAPTVVLPVSAVEFLQMTRWRER